MAYVFKGKDPFSSHNKIARIIINSNKKNIIDIGCNNGFIGQVLLQNNWKGTIEGLDKDGIYKKKVLDLGYKKFHKLDLEQNLSKLKGKYDVIVIGDVLEHLINPVEVLEKLKSNLKKDGIFVISLPNIANFYIRIQLIMGKFEYADKGILDRDHKYFYTQNTAQQMIKKSKLKIVKVKPTPIPLPVVNKTFNLNQPLFFIHLFSNVILRVRPTFFAYQYIFVCMDF
jgi:2-polyprenyl-3-methyl-5-hydroxy-6-metoxy-1,4-benzoquinol methylase